MSDYRILSRKYRPKRLNEVVGQEFSIKALSNAFMRNKLAHAFILTGIRGVGKTTIARIIAMGLNCLKEGKPVANPCNDCKNCRDILDDRFEEVLEIDAASHTGVEDVREIISYIKYRPTKGTFKVYIIDEVHMLSNSAFNALLKTIEEPPEYVKFIFCTTEVKKIPITIISRCQRYDLNRVERFIIEDYINSLAKKEDIKITEQAIKLISLYSEGSIRDSLSILDQALLTIEGNNIDIDNINKTLGLTGQEMIQDLFLNIIIGKTKEALDVLSKAYEKGGNPKTICDDLLRINYHLIYTLANNENKNVYDIYDKEKIDLILQKSSILLLNQTWQMLIKGKEEIEKLPQQIEALEIVVIRISFTSQLPQVEEIIDEIKKNKNDELKENMDNIDLGNDVKKILEIFPESKILKDNNK